MLLQLKESPLWKWHRADELFYREWGLAIARGEFSPGHVFEQGPFYAYLLGLFYALFGDQEAWLLFLQLKLGSLQVVLIYLIGKQIWGPVTGRVAALLAAVYCPFMFFEATVMKTWLTPLLLTWIAWCLLRVRSAAAAWRWLLAASIATGILILIRENYVLVVPLLCLAGWLQPIGEHRLRKQLVGLLLPIAVIAIMTAPASWHNSRYSDRFVWVTSGGGEVLYMAWGPSANGYYQPPPFVRPNPVYEHEDFRLEASRRLKQPVNYAESSAFWTRTAFFEAITHPIRSAWLIVRKLGILVNDFEVPDSSYFDVYRLHLPLLNWLPTFGWVIGLGCVGMSVPSRDPIGQRWLNGLMMVTVLSIVLTYNFSRFRLGMMPVVLLLAAACLVHVSIKLRHPSQRSQLTAVLQLLLAGGLSMLAFLPPPGYVEAGYPELFTESVTLVEQRQHSLSQLQRLQESLPAETAFSVEDRMRLAELKIDAALYSEAEQELNALLQESPRHPAALLEIGVLHGRRGRLAAAESAFRRLIEAEPNSVPGWTNLGNTYLHQTFRAGIRPEQRVVLLKQADQAYATGLSIDPENPICHQGRLTVRALAENFPTVPATDSN